MKPSHSQKIKTIVSQNTTTKTTQVPERMTKPYFRICLSILDRAFPSAVFEAQTTGNASVALQWAAVLFGVSAACSLARSRLTTSLSSLRRAPEVASTHSFAIFTGCGSLQIKLLRRHFIIPNS